MRSQLNPILSIAPGRKFSTQHIGLAISFSRIPFPSAVLVSNSNDLLVAIELREVQRIHPGDVTQLTARHVPTPVRSTFNTSAAKPAPIIWQHAGPACTPVKSMTLIPASGSRPVFSWFRGTLRVPVKFAPGLFPGNRRIRHEILALLSSYISLSLDLPIASVPALAWLCYRLLVSVWSVAHEIGFA